MLFGIHLIELLKNTKEEDSEALGKFMEMMEGVKKHLEMVFHRFLEQGKIKIMVSGQRYKSLGSFSPRVKMVFSLIRKNILEKVIFMSKDMFCPINQN